MKIRIALNTKKLSDFEKLTKLQTAITKLTGNADVGAAPAVLTAAQADYDAALAAVNLIDVKKKELAGLFLDKDAKVAKAMDTYAELGALVESKITDPAKVPDTGFALVAAATPTQPMPQVKNNVLTTGDGEGSADGAWDSLPGAKAYKVQISDDPTKPETWKSYDTVTVSSIHITGQPSGKRLWTRVCAVNGLGSGPWSDPATAMVP